MTKNHHGSIKDTHVMDSLKTVALLGTLPKTTSASQPADPETIVPPKVCNGSLGEVG